MLYVRIGVALAALTVSVAGTHGFAGSHPVWSAVNYVYYGPKDRPLKRLKPNTSPLKSFEGRKPAIKDLGIVSVQMLSPVTAANPARVGDVIPLSVVVHNFYAKPQLAHVSVLRSVSPRLTWDTQSISVPSKGNATVRLNAAVLKPQRGGDIYTATVILTATAAPRSLADRLRDANLSNNSKDISIPVAPPTFNLTIVWENFRVLDDCDNVSDGDWILTAVLRQNGRTVDTFIFGRRLVETGNTVRVNRTFTLRRAQPSDRFSLTITGVDCDSDFFFRPAPSAARTACHENSILEASGGNDSLGTLVFSGDVGTVRMGTFGRMTPTGSSDCPGAYMTSFKVQKRANW